MAGDRIEISSRHYKNGKHFASITSGYKRGSADFVILESGQMLIGENEPSVIQSAAVVDAVVVERGEHIYINLGKIEILQVPDTIVCLIKVEAFALGNFSPAGAFLFLPFFI